MDINALFGLSILMSFIALGIVTRLFIYPRLRAMRREDALLVLVAPHMFRFVGLSFLVPGVVAATLPSTFAIPVAYGDLVAAILAIFATLLLATHRSFAIPAVWVLSVWGTADLLHAIYLGQIGVAFPAGLLGAAFYIPTLIVPALLVLHGLAFWQLLRRQGHEPHKSSPGAVRS